MLFKLVFLIVIVLIFIFYPSTKMTTLDKVLAEINLDTKFAPQYNVWCSNGEATYNKRTKVSTSHCSCFVSYICKKLNIVIPSPPEYSQYHLATKQLKWLNTQIAKEHGWEKINQNIPDVYYEAIRLANKGHLVLVGIKQTHYTNGHISVVRPSSKLSYFIQHDGPDVITAGTINSYSMSMKEDFKLDILDLKVPINLYDKLEFYYNTKNV